MLFILSVINIWVRISETDHPNWMKIQIYFKVIFYDSVYHSWHKPKVISFKNFFVYNINN